VLMQRRRDNRGGDTTFRLIRGERGLVVLINTGSRHIKRRATAAKKDRENMEIAYIKAGEWRFGGAIRALVCGQIRPLFFVYQEF